MSKLEVNVSVAGEISFNNISQTETVNLRFTADEDIQGEFRLTIYNSVQKNSIVAAERILPVSGRTILWNINPDQQLPKGNHYYEIYSTHAKRIFFKSNLNINK